MKKQKLIELAKWWLPENLSSLLSGRLFLFDKETQESLPKTREEVIKLIRSGKVDYLVMDSFTLKNLRPRITSLALGLVPLPGAKVIYSRYFPSITELSLFINVGKMKNHCLL